MKDLARQLARIAPISLDAVPRDIARKEYAAFRGERGAAPISADLLTHPTHNVKLGKSAAPTYGLTLAQAATSSFNVCRFSSPVCRRGCVAFAGKGELASVQAGRIRKTQFLASEPHAFLALLADEIARHARRFPDLRVRLNTLSDLPWEILAPDLFERFAGVRFYDYTKYRERGPLPANYRLTYSASERTTDAEIVQRVSRGENVAVVFTVRPREALPAVWRGLRVIDADTSDDRWSDPTGVVVGLRAKGRMRRPGFAMVRTPRPIDARQQLLQEGRI